MSKNDVSLHNYLSKKEIYADLFNGGAFGGVQLVNPDNLKPIDSVSGAILNYTSKVNYSSPHIPKSKHKPMNKGKYNSGNNSYAIKRFRDIAMLWNDSVILMLLACEVQEKIHYAMPVRNMLYDALSYVDQLRSIWDGLSNAEKKDLDGKEFFSRLRKDDKLYPVITLVFYYGEEAWDGHTELYDLFDTTRTIDRELLEKYVPNYRINLVDVSNINDLSLYKSDLQILLHMVKYRKDKKALKEYIDKNEDYFRAVDYETMNAINAMINGGKLFDNILKENKEEYDMCQALQEIYEDGMACGIEQGIINLIDVLREMNAPDDDIINKVMSKYNMSTEEIQRYMAQ